MVATMILRALIFRPSFPDYLLPGTLDFFKVTVKKWDTGGLDLGS